MHDKPDLAALIGSRICHDLISPIGAIGNGVELMMMDHADSSPELGLIAQSVASAGARLRFFRLAFGVASRDQRIARSEFSAILADFLRGGKLKAEIAGPADLSRGEVKLVALLLLCLEHAMPWGGTLRIGCDTAAGGAGWRLEGEAQRMKPEAQLWQALSDREPLVLQGPAQVQFALAQEALAAQGLRLEVLVEENAIRLGF